MPLISIIVPVYNVEKYLKLCLDSVLSQTFTDYECILVDDGSPDNSPVICDGYVEKDSRFKVIHKENGGLSDARNIGIQTANGEYIALLDSDDMLADNASLTNLAKIIHNKESPVIFNSCNEVINNSNSIITDSVKKEDKYFTPYQFYNKVMSNKNNLMAAWLFCIKRSFIIEKQLYFKKGILHEDELWMPEIICSLDTIAINHDLFYTYRKKRDNSITSIITIRNLLDKLAIINQLKLYSENHDISEQKKAILKHRNAQLWYGIFTQVPKIDWTDFGDYYKILNELDNIKIVLIHGKKFGYKLLFIFLLCFKSDKLIRIYKLLKK